MTKLSKSFVTVLYDETSKWHECSETIKLAELSSKRLKVTKLVEGNGSGRARKRAEAAMHNKMAKKAKGHLGCQVCEKLLLARGKVRARQLRSSK